MNWVYGLLEQFAKVEGIATTPERIAQAEEYFIQQGYDEFLSIACKALLYDRKTREILTGNIDIIAAEAVKSL